MANLNVSCFSQLKDEEITQMMESVTIKISIIEKLNENQTIITCKGAGDKRLNLIIHKSKAAARLLGFVKTRVITLRNFGLKPAANGDINLTYETLTTIEKIDKTAQLSNVEKFSNNGICSGIFVLRSATTAAINSEFSNSCFTLISEDLERPPKQRVFKAYSSTKSDLPTQFDSSLRSNNAQPGDIVEIKNFSIVPLSGGRRDFRLRKESSIAFFGQEALVRVWMFVN